jgi:hypothetical protein
VASLQTRYGWLTIPIEIGGLFVFEAALTLLSRSQISQALLDFVMPLGAVRSLGGARYLLRELTVTGVGIADLEVGASARLQPLPVQAIFGVDFLRQFRAITLDPSSWEITFADP